MPRRTIPNRCNAPSLYYAPTNGYRSCDAHVLPGMLASSEAGPGPHGPCDYPLDGLGCARYEAQRRLAFSSY